MNHDVHCTRVRPVLCSCKVTRRTSARSIRNEIAGKNSWIPARSLPPETKLPTVAGRPSQEKRGSLFLGRSRLCRLCRLILGRNAREDRLGGRTTGHNDRQGNRSHHEKHCGPGRCFRKRGRRATRAKGSLAAHAPESGSNVATLTALQQDDNDQEQTDNDVDDGDECNDHFVFELRAACAPAFLVSAKEKFFWCEKGDLHSPTNTFNDLQRTGTLCLAATTV